MDFKPFLTPIIKNIIAGKAMISNGIILFIKHKYGYLMWVYQILEPEKQKTRPYKE